MNKVYIIMTDGDPSEHKAYIEDVALFTMNYEQVIDKACSIVCMSPESIRTYNKQYRGKDYVPDVLSFVDDNTIIDLGQDKNSTHTDHSFSNDAIINSVINEETVVQESYLGDILICENQIAYQAQEHKVNYFEELARIIIHGMLHLLGYIHESYDKEEPMLIRQEEILNYFQLNNS